MTRRGLAGLVTDERPLVGFLVVVGVGVSFGLTIFLFGFLVLAALVAAVVALALLPSAGTRRAGVRLLEVAVIMLAGPVIYVGLAVLRAA